MGPAPHYTRAENIVCSAVRFLETDLGIYLVLMTIIGGVLFGLGARL